MPVSTLRKPQPRIRVEHVASAARLRPLPRQAHGGRERGRRGDGHSRRPRDPRRLRLLPRAGQAPLRGAAPLEPRRQRRLRRLVCGHGVRPLGVRDRSLERPLGDLARRAAAQGRGRTEGSRRRARRGRGAARDSAARRRDGARLDGVGSRRASTRSDVYAIEVDRELARFGAWYELFPRSFGGFAGVERVLPDIAELGFDVVYLPPIHPIGRTGRKGRNNTLPPSQAIPAARGRSARERAGTTRSHPELGTLADFDRLVARAQRARARDRARLRACSARRTIRG